MDNVDYFEELSIWNINSIVNYFLNNFIQFTMLICVFLIIYFVDHISFVNNNSQLLPHQFPFLQQVVPQIKIIKNKKTKK